MNKKVNDNNLDITAITTMAEAAFAEFNRVALSGAGEEAAYGLEPEVKKVWHYSTPIESTLDGLHKALNGSEYMGRKRRGINDYLEASLNYAARLNDNSELLDQAATDKAGAARFTPKGEEIYNRIQDLKHLKAMYEQMIDVFETAFGIASGGDDYKDPMARRAMYEAREQNQAKAQADLAKLMGL